MIFDSDSEDSQENGTYNSILFTVTIFLGKENDQEQSWLPHLILNHSNKLEIETVTYSVLNAVQKLLNRQFPQYDGNNLSSSQPSRYCHWRSNSVDECQFKSLDLHLCE